ELALSPISTLFPYTTLFRSFFTMNVLITHLNFFSLLTTHYSLLMTNDYISLINSLNNLIIFGSVFPAMAMISEMLTGFRLSGSRSEEHTSELQSRENLVCRL